MERKELVRRFYEQCNRRDVRGMHDLLGRDFVEHTESGDFGPEQTIEKMLRWLETPGAAYEIVVLFQGEEDDAAAYTKIRANGVTLARTADLFEIKDGTITEKWSMVQRA